MLELSTTIDDAVGLHPRLARLFMQRHMICVGCDIARFHTIQDAAQMYDIDPEEFLQEIRTAIVTYDQAALSIDADSDQNTTQ